MTPTLVADDSSLHAGVSRRAAGFTLLELLVVLALILIGTGLIIPNLSTTATSSFNADVRQAVAILKYARRVAIVEGSPRIARFIALDARSADFAERQRELQAQRNPADWISDSITLQFRSDLNQRAEDRDDIEVVFFPQGGSTGGVLGFDSADFHADVRVDSLTGRISVAYSGEQIDEEALDAAF
jgi:general secretion pathway protein H